MVKTRAIDFKEEVEHSQLEIDQMYRLDSNPATNLDRFYQYDKLYHQDQMIFQYRQLNTKKNIGDNLINLNFIINSISRQPAW